MMEEDPMADAGRKESPGAAGESAPLALPKQRLSKADKKKVNKAKRKSKKSAFKAQELAERLARNPARGHVPRVLTPVRTRWEEWRRLEPVEAMGRLRVCVVAGRTGVGKTKVLDALRGMGHPVVDLEGLADHLGSTFGWCGRGDAMCEYQPTTEHFQNKVAMAWREAAVQETAAQSHLGWRWVFLEDEGRLVGRCELPKALFSLLRCAPLVVRVGVPIEARVKALMDEYTSPSVQGGDPDGWMSDMLLSMDRLERKMGSERVAQMKNQMKARDFEAVTRLLLGHYDHLYDLHAVNRAGSEASEKWYEIREVEQSVEIQDRIDAVGLASAVVEQVVAFDSQPDRPDHL
eukprot:TRINITY_DN17307_c0_g2_i1.p1 TRINITY_DN17307_c0_g2~~TRINITY_DN17307_c0_g2_i1.p1  ORF type:complete len:348 (-),score=59.38 TRINITY_DN17307_c0_g2_i1:275-1318(-)